MRVNVNRIANLIICSIDEIRISLKCIERYNCVFNLQFATTTNNDSIEIYKRARECNVKLEISNFYHVRNDVSCFIAHEFKGDEF